MPAKFYAADGITAEFGITDEDNMLVQSFSYEVSSDKVELYDTEGELAQVARFNKKASISISGIVNEGSAPEVGVTFVVANAAAGQLDGTILVDSVTENLSSDNFRTIEISATQYDTELSLIIAS
jgi:hypothetical protein